MTGTVVTFYSYKGGVGRTFALANTAAVLARWGYRTLCVDWDLDAPGLTHYLRPWLAAQPTAGVVDLVAARAAGERPKPGDYVVPVALPDAADRLDLLPAGAGDEAYVRRSQELDWADLYERRDLGGLLESWRERWTADYDVVLVDSRTGITDIGGICTAQLPDLLVMLFTANEQSLGGTLDVARRAWRAHNALPYDRAGLRVVPVPSRFDAREEYERAGQWQARFTAELAPLVGPWASRELPVEKLLGHLTIPYVSYWSFGEDLPAVVEPDPTPDRIGYALESLAALVAHRLDRTELLASSRDAYVAAAARAGLRKGAVAGYDVFISSAGSQEWMAAWLARALADRALSVFTTREPIGIGFAPAGQRRLPVRDAIARSAALVVLLGPDGAVGPEVELFLRQALDDASVRPVIPVLLPHTGRIPPNHLLSQFQAARLPDDSEESLRALATEIERIAARTAPVPAQREPALPEAFAEAADLLDDALVWRLDDLRWQLVEQQVGAMEDALAERDEPAIVDLTSDLAQLGPVRSSYRGNAGPVDIPGQLAARVRPLIARLRG